MTIGFGLGVYSLPILMAETGLDDAAIAARQPTIERLGKFYRNLEGSDNHIILACFRQIEPVVQAETTMMFSRRL